MENFDERKSADRFAKIALSSMQKHGVSPTPENYTIFYHYAAGGNLDLKQALDVLTADNRDLDDESLRIMFQKYFGGVMDSGVLRDTSDHLDTVVSNIMDSVQTASKDADAFGHVLAAVTDNLEINEEVDLRRLVAVVVNETRKIEGQNQKLQGELNNYSAEINRLRKDLEFVRREARTDGLTGIANRKLFDNFLDEAAVDTVENGQKLCLLMTDVDKFKNFNDTYGHQLGDQVLRVVASILKANTTDRDLPARYGGEEFCVVLPNTSLNDAETVAERIRTAVAAKKIVKKRTGEQLRQVTISIGVAEFSYGEPVADLVSRADRALYQAKHEGRNKVILETELAPEVATA